MNNIKRTLTVVDNFLFKHPIVSYIIIFVALFVGLLVISASDNRNSFVPNPNDTTLVRVDFNGSAGWSVYVVRDTRVMYLYGGEAFTLLVNPDGTPMIWEGAL